MKKRLLSVIAASAVSATSFLAACGGGGSSGTAAIAGSPNTVISDAAQGGSAASFGYQNAFTADAVTGDLLVTALGGSTGSYAAGASARFQAPTAARVDRVYARLRPALARATQSSRARVAGLHARLRASGAGVQAIIPVDQTVPCIDGGSYRVAGSYDDMGFALDLTYTYSACREFASEANGSVRVTADNGLTSAKFSVQMGNGDAVIDSGDYVLNQYADNTYATVIETFSGSVTIGMKVNAALTFTLTADGRYEDSYTVDSPIVPGTTFAVTFDRYEAQYTESGNTWSEVLNGGYVLSKTTASTSESASFTYRNLTIAWTDYGSYVDVSIDGRMTVDFTPDGYCFEGTFDYVTNTPVRYEHAVGHTTAGRITINGTTVVTFNADGSVTVTVGGVTQTYASLRDFENACPLMSVAGP